MKSPSDFDASVTRDLRVLISNPRNARRLVAVMLRAVRQGNRVITKRVAEMLQASILQAALQDRWQRN